MTVRNSDPETSHASAGASHNLAQKLRAKILELAQAAGPEGITSNEAERGIPGHKPNAISPRFAELVKRGQLVRVQTGKGKPTKHYPYGIPRFLTRYDAETKRPVLVHWVPQFAPGKKLPQGVTIKAMRGMARRSL